MSPLALRLVFQKWLAQYQRRTVDRLSIKKSVDSARGGVDCEALLSATSSISVHYLGNCMTKKKGSPRKGAGWCLMGDRGVSLRPEMTCRDPSSNRCRIRRRWAQTQTSPVKSASEQEIPHGHMAARALALPLTDTSREAMLCRRTHAHTAGGPGLPLAFWLAFPAAHLLNGGA